MKPAPVDEQISRIIRLAWEERTGLTERQVIEVMRRELMPSSFRLWRKRISGRITKHRKLLEQHLKGAPNDE